MYETNKQTPFLQINSTFIYIYIYIYIHKIYNQVLPSHDIKVKFLSQFGRFHIVDCLL